MSEISHLGSPGSFSEAAIFGRIVEQSGGLSRELAEHVLSLGFSANDQSRVEELLDRNADGGLSEAERTELENLNHVADLLSLWHSRARHVLNLLDGS